MACVNIKKGLLTQSAENMFWPLTNTNRLCYGIHIYIRRKKRNNSKKKYTNKHRHTNIQYASSFSEYLTVYPYRLAM